MFAPANGQKARAKARKNVFFTCFGRAAPMFAGLTMAAVHPLCAIWQTVNADARLRPRFSVGKAAGVGCPGQSIPWIAFSIPWIGRSIPWNFRSKACFKRKNSPGLCHIAAKIAFWGSSVAGRLTHSSEYQVFLIFAYLRAGERALENIAAMVLKFRCREQ